MKGKGGIVQGSIPVMIQPCRDIPLTLKPIDWDTLSDKHEKNAARIVAILFNECVPANTVYFASIGPDREFIDAVKVILNDGNG